MVSILMAVWNGASRLPETLKSLDQQTIKDWELVAVDDGSTDDSRHVLQQFALTHPGQVHILQNEQNQGLTKSLVRAAAAAQGELLARIDVGDQFAPTKLAQQVAYLNGHLAVGILGCNYVNIIRSSGWHRPSHVPIADAAIRQSIVRKNPFAHSAVVMRTPAYRQAGGYNPDIRYGQDYDLWFRMLRLTQAANLPEILCTRYVDDESISTRFRRAQMWQTLKTQWRYMNHWNPLHYVYLAEPLAMLLLPEAIRQRQHQSK